jgi:shikimate dehydrogenase
MRKFGLIGYPLSHSFSPSYFKKKFEKEGIHDAEYRAYPIENAEKMYDLISAGIIGLNVTIPYKEEVIPLLDELDETAAVVQAVNTIKLENGRLKGYNTDVYGFEMSLSSFLSDHKIENAFILGTGGAAKAVEFVLRKLKIKYTYISRKDSYLNYGEITKKMIENHRLIINTTPLGMQPNIHTFPPLPYNGISDKHFCYDLVYNPEKTLFLKKAAGYGAKIKNGSDMLFKQAEKSWQIWNHQ